MGIGSIDLEELVAAVMRRDERGEADLYALVIEMLRHPVFGKLGCEQAMDIIHDCYIVILQQVRSGKVNEPLRLKGYIAAVGRNHVIDNVIQKIHDRALYVDHDGTPMFRDRPDSRLNPEQAAIAKQHMEIAERSLGKLQKNQRTVLERFYMKGDSRAEIMRDMNLDPDQYRLLKHRAKHRLGVVGKRDVRTKIKRNRQYAAV